MPRTKWVFTDDQRKETLRNLDNTGKGLQKWWKNATNLENWDFEKTEELRSLNDSLNSRLNINMDKRKILEGQLGQTRKQLQQHAEIAHLRGQQIERAQKQLQQHAESAHLTGQQIERAAILHEALNKKGMYSAHSQEGKELTTLLHNANQSVQQNKGKELTTLLHNANQSVQQNNSYPLSRSLSQHSLLPAPPSRSLPHSRSYSSPQPVRPPRTTT